MKYLAILFIYNVLPQNDQLMNRPDCMHARALNDVNTRCVNKTLNYVLHFVHYFPRSILNNKFFSWNHLSTSNLTDINKWLYIYNPLWHPENHKMFRKPSLVLVRFYIVLYASVVIVCIVFFTSCPFTSPFCSLFFLLPGRRHWP